ncbi:MAG: PQQ-binding-like beta-propeller repeat protein [Fimbriiglobus sp.]
MKSVLTVLLFASNIAFAADWPGFLGPKGDSSSSEVGILKVWPKEGLKKLWETPLGIGYAPPVVAKGKLYHFDRTGDNNILTCRNARTGEFEWKHEIATDYEDMYGYDSGPRACPVVAGDHVYFYGPDGVIGCVDITTKKQVWAINTREKYRFHQNFFGVGSVPLVYGDLLIVAIGGSPKGSRPADLRDARGDGTGIVAFDRKTGVEKYRLSNELASYSSPMLVTLEGKTVCLYFARGGLLGFDPATGKELFNPAWRAKILESVNAANPLVFDDQILVSDCYERGSVLWKVTKGKLETIWSDAKKDRDEQALMAHWCTPILHEGHIYGCSGRNANDSDLRCIDAKTGDIKWVERRTTRLTLLKVDGHLISLGEQGQLRLIRPTPEKYVELAKWDAPDLSYPSWAPPVLCDGILYLRGKDDQSRTGHKLVAYELIPKK